MTVSRTEVVIVIPTFNEGKRLLHVVDKIHNLGFGKIVVVDDGSTDHSVTLLSGQGIIILRHLVNRGAGAATETGLKYCRDVLNANTVVMIDADTQHDVHDIDVLLKHHQEQNADISIGNRFMMKHNAIPAKNRVFNSFADVITSIFAGKRILDSQSGFKVFSRQALYKIYIEHDRYEHCSEILIKGYQHGLKIINVPVRVYYPSEIKDKGQHFMNGIRTFVNLLYSTLFKHN